MAYGGFCPLPAHHPEAAASEVFQEHLRPVHRTPSRPNYLNFPVMGAWVPVEYRPDDIIVLRRNPYYWKVDEKGNQLPYLDELPVQALDLG